MAGTEMAGEQRGTGLEALQSDRPEEIEEGIRHVREGLAGLPEAEFRAAVEALCALFYVDTHDRPDLEPGLEKAVEALAAIGPRVVPHLLELMRGSDIKSHLYLARTLGAIGPPALPALRQFVSTGEDPYSRSFGLFALGKIRHPRVREALPEVIASLGHPDKEVRDSAARTLGKFAEVVPPENLTEAEWSQVFDALFGALGDFQAAVRAKAIRSLGKLVRAGDLGPEQEQRVATAARALLGEDERQEWDRAYIVRREAREALQRVVERRGQRTPLRPGGSGRGRLIGSSLARGSARRGPGPPARAPGRAGG